MTGCHGRKAYAYFSDRFYCQSAAGCKSATICGLLRTTWRSKETTINGIRRARTLFCVLFYLGQNRRENRQLMVKSEENGTHTFRGSRRFRSRRRSTCRGQWRRCVVQTASRRRLPTQSHSHSSTRTLLWLCRLQRYGLHGQRQGLSSDWYRCSGYAISSVPEKFVKFGHVVFEIRKQTNRDRYIDMLRPGYISHDINSQQSNASSSYIVVV